MLSKEQLGSTTTVPTHEPIEGTRFRFQKCQSNDPKAVDYGHLGDYLATPFEQDLCVLRKLRVRSHDMLSSANVLLKSCTRTILLESL